MMHQRMYPTKRQQRSTTSGFLSTAFITSLIQHFLLLLSIRVQVVESFLPTTKLINSSALAATPPSPSTTHESSSSTPTTHTIRKSRISPFSSRNKRDPIKLTFTGIHSVASPFIPHSPRDAVLLQEYFTQDKYRNLLFPDNEAITLTDPPTTQELDIWTREATLAGGILPQEAANTINSHRTLLKQCMFQINAPLDFPGLKITSQSTIGMICVTSSETTTAHNLPEYQFTLLESKTIPQGPKPLVWLFNQISKYQDATSSFTRVKAISSHESKNEIQFVTDARLAIQIQLPAKLLKILPVSRTKFEEQGSESIQKLLENDLEPALNGFCQGFRKYSLERELELESVGALRP